MSKKALNVYTILSEISVKRTQNTYSKLNESEIQSLLECKYPVSQKQVLDDSELLYTICNLLYTLDYESVLNLLKGDSYLNPIFEASKNRDFDLELKNGILFGCR